MKHKKVAKIKKNNFILLKSECQKFVFLQVKKINLVEVDPMLWIKQKENLKLIYLLNLWIFEIDLKLKLPYLPKCTKSLDE